MELLWAPYHNMTFFLPIFQRKILLLVFRRSPPGAETYNAVKWALELGCWASTKKIPQRKQTVRWSETWLLVNGWYSRYHRIPIVGSFFRLYTTCSPCLLGDYISPSPPIKGAIETAEDVYRRSKNCLVILRWWPFRDGCWWPPMIGDEKGHEVNHLVLDVFATFVGKRMEVGDSISQTLSCLKPYHPWDWYI